MTEALRPVVVVWCFAVSVVGGVALGGVALAAVTVRTGAAVRVRCSRRTRQVFEWNGEQVSGKPHLTCIFHYTS